MTTESEKLTMKQAFERVCELFPDGRHVSVEAQLSRFVGGPQLSWRLWITGARDGNHLSHHTTLETLVAMAEALGLRADFNTEAARIDGVESIVPAGEPSGGDDAQNG